MAEVTDGCCGMPDLTRAGGLRVAHDCGRRATDTYDGQPMCRIHADQARYRR